MAADDAIQHRLSPSFPSLSRAILDQPIHAPGSKDILATVGQFIDAAYRDAEPPAWMLPALHSLCGHAHRIVLPLLMRAHDRGELTLHDDVAFPLKLAAAGILASLGGHATARRLTGEVLTARAQAQPGPQLAPPDVLRANLLHARCLLRSGEAERGGEMLRHLLLARPAEAPIYGDAFHALAVSRPDTARDLARAALLSGLEHAPTTWLAFAEFFMARRDIAEAIACLARAAHRGGVAQEHLLSGANLALRQDEPALWVDLVRRYGAANGMLLDASDARQANRVFAFEGGGMPDTPHEELISVVMTAFNAASTLEAAARSVLVQRGCAVELIIVDDASTDRTAEIIARLAASDGRVKPVLTGRNGGTYVARNLGISMATGAVLTFHDSDDWMHPLRLHRQLTELKKGFVCTTSHWLRMQFDGRVIPRWGGHYAHLNPASAMFRQALIAQIGPFDAVRAGADAEHLARIRLRYGWNSVAPLPDCLGLGLHHEYSLTQSGATAIDPHRSSPIRLAYAEAWLDWHLTRMERHETVQMQPGKSWPFPVPEDMLP